MCSLQVTQDVAANGVIADVTGVVLPVACAHSSSSSTLKLQSFVFHTYQPNTLAVYKFGKHYITRCSRSIEP
jgi:hypothetical protein